MQHILVSFPDEEPRAQRTEAPHPGSRPVQCPSGLVFPSGSAPSGTLLLEGSCTGPFDPSSPAPGWPCGHFPECLIPQDSPHLHPQMSRSSLLLSGTRARRPGRVPEAPSVQGGACLHLTPLHTQAPPPSPGLGQSCRVSPFSLFRRPREPHSWAGVCWGLPTPLIPHTELPFGPFSALFLCHSLLEEPCDMHCPLEAGAGHSDPYTSLLELKT